MTIRKILIANRGEIALRIMRTAHDMGIGSVAVYSDADVDAPHVAAADEAVPIGPASPRESYLNIDRVIEAAQQTGANAIHPGYGFLSENATFARRCEEAGIIFIGPPIRAIEEMGLKSVSKQLMEKANVPLVPGYHGEGQDTDLLVREAERIGFPLLIKASAGGGGKGMRVVRSQEALHEGLEGARREAASSFGNDHLLLERYVERPRHVEVQILFDQAGNGVYLFDRDCSIQRRHQKIIEEAPAPGLDDKVRQAMGEAAVRAGQAVDYVGAGTVEFLVDAEQRFYFMEMNTRLQVEHPVTELVTGLDLVEWQIRVAQGEPLPWAQHDLRQKGHAIEARLYAEDPDREFLPTTGRITHLSVPADLEGVRIDTGLRESLVVGSDYDPMLAKLIAWGPNRESARQRLVDALSAHRLAGLKTNTGYLVRALDTADFRDAELTTLFVEDHAGQLHRNPFDTEQQLVSALVGWIDDAWSSRDPHDPWTSVPGWRLGASDWQQAEIRLDGENHILQYRLEDRARLRYRKEDSDTEVLVRWQPEADALRVRSDGRKWSIHTVFDGIATWTVFAHGEQWNVSINHPEMAHAEEDEKALTAPMHGRITAVPCAEGDVVEAGAALVIMEAMKMEHTVRAPARGKVLELMCAVGDSVEAEQVLVEFEPEETDDD
ncbi:acetyl/propionyl/methylcrotonyl-CoA carboxylase subunit alpha [Marinobacteraceae bacterium S3BR75-40.1]